MGPPPLGKLSRQESLRKNVNCTRGTSGTFVDARPPPAAALSNWGDRDATPRGAGVAQQAIDP